MSFSAEDAAKIAVLARLKLSDETLGQFASQIDGILEYMAELNSLDTAGVGPMYSPSEHATPLREDRAVMTNTREQILSNAPNTDGAFFIVPKIV